MNSSEITAADAVWVATALLHKEQPESPAFSVKQIVQSVKEKRLSSREEMTIYLHANQHCVANRPPKNSRLCMLVETPDGLRRLYHEGDAIDPRRTGARRLPEREALPDEFKGLLNWYETWNRNFEATSRLEDPLEALEGSWTFGDADTYLREMRDGWKERP